MSDTEIAEWVKIANSTDDPCIPNFYIRPVHQARRSEEEGRPIYAQVPFVKIIIPGDPNNVHDTEVKDAHRKRWPAQWAAFESRQDSATTGTPIEQWAFVNVAQAAVLKALNIATVEQLAGVSDSALERIGPGARNLRTRAQQHLQSSDETEKELRATIGEMQGQIADLTARLEQTLKQPAVDVPDVAVEDAPPVKRGRGRPRKAVSNDAE